MAEVLRKIKGMLHHEPRSGVSFSLIVGLGNPGAQYAGNRHNVGFHCIERLARRHDIPLRKIKFKASFGEGRIGAHAVILAEPLTFMNDSGQAVAPLSHWYKIPPERILVIHDDLDLPLGKVRLRPDGASGGHRGLNSLIAALGTRDFARLRVGIGRPAQGDPVDYVLNDFGRDQVPVMEATYDLVERIVICYLDEGIRAAMNQFNGA
jgi:PTH1 family peptidyl-tRNA hydrolase